MESLQLIVLISCNDSMVPTLTNECPVGIQISGQYMHVASSSNAERTLHRQGHDGKPSRQQVSGLVVSVSQL